MFSKELDNLIQSSLEDGVLEEYEKAALIKRAQAESVDLIEFLPELANLFAPSPPGYVPPSPPPVL